MKSEIGLYRIIVGDFIVKLLLLSKSSILNIHKKNHSELIYIIGQLDLTDIHRKPHPLSGTTCYSQWHVELALKSIHSLGHKTNVNK